MKRREYLGISEIGFCSRRVFYNHQPDLEPEITPETARKFELGHLIEGLRKRELKREGLKIQEAQKEVALGVDVALGHIDGYLMAEDGQVVLWECKSTTCHSVHKWRRESLPRHIAYQIQGYMMALETDLAIPVRTCRVDVVDRTSGEAFVWTYERDEFMQDEVYKRALGLSRAIRQSQVPTQEFEENSSECRYCPYRSTCRPQATIPTESSREHQDAASWAGFGEALELYEAGQQLKEEGEQLVTQAREAILGQLEAHRATRATAHGILVSWSQVSTTKFDAKALQAKMPDVYSKFLKPSSYQRLEVRR